MLSIKKILTLSILVLAIGCKKYSADSHISLASANARITKKWTLDQLYKNKLNVSDSIHSIADSYTITFDKNNTFELAWDKTLTIGTYVLPLHYTRKGTWEFTNKKNILQMHYSDDNSMQQLPILQLTKTNLWVSTTDKNDTYEWHFKK